jgi:hypothetical protein
MLGTLPLIHRVHCYFSAGIAGKFMISCGELKFASILFYGDGAPGGLRQDLYLMRQNARIG